MIPAGSLGPSASRALKRVRRPVRKPSGGFERSFRDLSVASVASEAFYKQLAAHLDADLLTHPPSFAADADWRLALRTGVIRLADGRWLLAPRGAEIETLLAHVSPGRAGARLALAAPEHFERAVLAHFAAEIAADAAGALPQARPEFCARGGAAARRPRTRS